MLRYVFMGSPPLAATILKHVCEVLYPPVAVVTQEAKEAGRGQALSPTAVETWARAKGLALFPTADVNQPQIIEALRAQKPDLLLVAAFGQILKDPILQLPRLFCLNVHASLLPRYRGAAPVQRAIASGDAETGVTIQKMAKKLDTGDILLQRKTPIGPEETSGELLARLAHLGAEALVEAVRQVESGNYTFTLQEEALATYAKKLTREEAILDWSLPAATLRNQIRALQPWPVAETRLGKDRLKIFRAQIQPLAQRLTPGEISTDAKTYLSVACGDGQALSLTELQLENRKRLEIRDFLMAYRGTFPHKKMGTP